MSGYRIERTREGREYELVGEITGPGWFLVDAPPGEAWFYRVTAFNAKGAGHFRLVWLFRRGDRFQRGGHNLDNFLTAILAGPGLQMDVWM